MEPYKELSMSRILQYCSNPLWNGPEALAELLKGLTRESGAGVRRYNPEQNWGLGFAEYRV